MADGGFSVHTCFFLLVCTSIVRRGGMNERIELFMAIPKGTHMNMTDDCFLPAINFYKQQQQQWPGKGNSVVMALTKTPAFLFKNTRYSPFYSTSFYHIHPVPLF